MKELKGQLTARSLVIGIIGALILTSSSLFVALKTSALPWPIMFASLVSLLLLRALKHTNNREITVTHTAMSAGSMVAGGFAFTLPAIYILDPQANVDLLTLILVTLCGTLLGLLFSSLFRRYFIDKSKMPFAMGQAAAKVIQSNKGQKSTKIALVSSFSLAGLLGIVRDGLLAIPAGISFSGLGQFGSKAGLSFSLMLPAVGYIIGPATVLVWFLGGCIGDFGILTIGQLSGQIDQAMALSLKSNIGLGWMVGVGVAIIVKEIFPNIKNFFHGISTHAEGGIPSIVIYTLAPSIIIISLIFIFVLDVPVAAMVTVLVGVWLTSVMSAQCVGQSSIDPMEVFGILVMAIIKFFFPDMPMSYLVFAAAVVAIASGLTGDMMNDFKSGAAFKTSVKAQWIAEAAGSIVGAIAVSIIFFVLVQAFGGSIFGSDIFPAAQSAAVAQLVGGVDNPLVFNLSAVISLIVYLFTPKLAMLGLGIYLPFNLTLTVCVGGLIRFIVKLLARRRKNQKASETAAIQKSVEHGDDISFAAGLLAGEGFVGIIITVFQALMIIFAL